MFYWYLKHSISRKDLIILPQIFTLILKCYRVSHPLAHNVILWE